VPLQDKKECLTAAQAEQIAHLLNLHNKLQSPYDGRRILNSNATYYPEHFEGLVFGSVAVQRMNFMLTEIKHLVVHPAFRKMGLARVMLGKAMGAAVTPLLFATIRADNEGSLHLFQGEGFKPVAKARVDKHQILFLLRTNESYYSLGPGGARPGKQTTAFGYPLKAG